VPSTVESASAAAPHGGARAHRPAPATMDIAFMSQNIFYGGDDYNLRTGDFCRVPNGCPLALHHLRLFGDILEQQQAHGAVHGVQLSTGRLLMRSQ